MSVASTSLAQTRGNPGTFYRHRRAVEGEQLLALASVAIAGHGQACLVTVSVSPPCLPLDSALSCADVKYLSRIAVNQWMRESTPRQVFLRMEAPPPKIAHGGEGAHPSYRWAGAGRGARASGRACLVTASVSPCRKLFLQAGAGLGKTTLIMHTVERIKAHDHVRALVAHSSQVCAPRSNPS